MSSYYPGNPGHWRYSDSYRPERDRDRERSPRPSRRGPISEEVGSSAHPGEEDVTFRGSRWGRRLREPRDYRHLNNSLVRGNGLPPQTSHNQRPRASQLWHNPSQPPTLFRNEASPSRPVRPGMNERVPNAAAESSSPRVSHRDPPTETEVNAGGSRDNRILSHDMSISAFKISPVKATTLDHSNVPADSSTGTAQRPIKLEDTPSPKTKNSDLPSQESVSHITPYEQTIANNEAIKSNCACGETRANLEQSQVPKGTITAEEPPSPVARIRGKRKATTKSPAFIAPTDTWWLPVNRKIRLLEICLGLEAEYFKSDDSELQPDSPFWEKIVTRFNSENETKRFSDWKFARAYTLDLCKDRHDDIVSNKQLLPRRDIDPLARMVDKWARVMIRRKAHKATQLGGNEFWMSFGGMVRAAVQQVTGTGNDAQTVVNSIKSSINEEKETIEHRYVSRASRNAKKPAEVSTAGMAKSSKLKEASG